MVLDVSAVRDTKGSNGVAGRRTGCSACDHSRENTRGLALGIVMHRMSGPPARRVFTLRDRNRLGIAEGLPLDEVPF